MSAPRPARVGSAPESLGAITDVPGVLVGHYERLGDGWATGTTVVLAPSGATCGVDCRGGAPGTRETDLLAPENLVQQVHGICLSGGSAYGLAAADGVMHWLEQHGHGLPVGQQAREVVPVVPAAVIFDLPRGMWGNRPEADFGYRACAAAGSGTVAQGSVGAGTGAKVGSLKGGVGTASILVAGTGVPAGSPQRAKAQDTRAQGAETQQAGTQGTGAGFILGALAVVNARGEAVDPATGRPWAAAEARASEFGVRAWPARSRLAPADGEQPPGEAPPEEDSLNTTIGVVATDAALSKAECRRLAMSAHDGLARALRPAHSMFDGDTVFALATGARELGEEPGAFGLATRAAVLDELCDAAARSFAHAVVAATVRAEGIAGLGAYRDHWPEAFADPAAGSGPGGGDHR